MPDWRDKAACLDVSPEWFFPDQEWKQVENARNICGRCEVIASCGRFALENDIHEGVWGGMTERDRRRLRRVKAAQ